MRAFRFYRLPFMKLFSGKRFCVCEHANHQGIDAEGAGEMFKVTFYLTEHQEPRMEK
jgi:hypothetical protein